MGWKINEFIRQKLTKRPLLLSQVRYPLSIILSLNSLIFQINCKTENHIKISELNVRFRQDKFNRGFKVFFLRLFILKISKAKRYPSNIFNFKNYQKIPKFSGNFTSTKSFDYKLSYAKQKSEFLITFSLMLRKFHSFSKENTNNIEAPSPQA